MSDGGPTSPEGAPAPPGGIAAVEPSPVGRRRRRPWERPAHRRPIHHRWAFWQSPLDQPRWARPALLVVAALAALSYAWGLDNAALEPFYGAAARSMSTSWHNFFFGAFDPDGTVTVDKLPGALWLQALSLRAFGFNTWAIVMPQVVEGILTVLVLYRAVRRLAGPVAGIVAAVVLAASPVTALLNRGNISDSLLILLLALAADATSRALMTGRLRSLLAAGVWVGLAFQAKMTQAWLVLPALWLVYLIASPARPGRRMVHVIVATVVTVLVSLSWMLAVTAVPTHDRPYVDGSRNDSEFAQVFDYNGVARFGGTGALTSSVGPVAPFLQVGLRERASLNGSTAFIGRSWHRLLSGLLGRDDGWLLPAALFAFTSLLVARRRQPRTDPVRACGVLWGTWLLVHVVVFSDGVYLNSYYTAALSPAIAALCGIGLCTAWRAGRLGRALLALVVAGSAGYALYLLPTATGVRPWLVPALGAAAIIAVVLLLASVVRRWDTTSVASVALVAATLAAVLAPAVATATVVTTGLGPFDTPFEPPSVTAVTQTDTRFALERAAVTAQDFEAVARRSGARILFATDTSAVASGFILASGKEILPIGGFTGAIPSPTLTQIRNDITSGQLDLAIVPVDPAGHDPRIVWIRRHCHVVSIDRPAPVRYGIYNCGSAASL